MRDKKKVFWNQMDELIGDVNASQNERKVFLNAKKELDNGKNDQAVAEELKSKLSFLALKNELSPKSISFFSELSRLYLGYGRRDMINF